MKSADSSANRILDPVRATFRAVARTVAPDTASLDEAGWDRVESIVADALAARPPRVRRQLLLFVRLLDWMALVRHGRRFGSLDQRARVRLLARVQDAPLLLLRRGFWGLRTLIYMGWYAQPGTAAGIGYRAALGGWEARPGETPTTPLP